jgi:ketopantoate reductase
MRLMVVGGGAVGVTLGVHLEHGKHEVAYLVRPGRRAGMARVRLVQAASGATRVRERPTVFELGEELPPFEHALLCVRGDQLDEAAQAARAHLPREVALVSCAAAPPEAIARLRGEHPGPVAELMPFFSAWSEEPGVWRWFQPPLVKTMVSGEGEERADPIAKALAEALEAVGITARTVPSLQRRSALPSAAGAALLAGWELAGWDLAELARDKPLRVLTARAMAEAAKASGGAVEGAGRLLALAPAPALSLLLAAAPRLVPANARAMWRHHGPKIRAQTRLILDGLLATGSRFEHLAELRGRLPPCPE